MTRHDGPQDLHVTGSFRLAPNARLLGGVECEGEAALGDHARVEGDVRVTGDVEVGSGVRVDGALESEGSIVWDASARAGRLRSGGPFRLGDHAVAGSLDARRGVAPAPGVGK